jgi:hypothetical protein
MRSLRWVPIAYLAGLHGFALFAPYVALVMMARHIVLRIRATNLSKIEATQVATQP